MASPSLVIASPSLVIASEAKQPRSHPHIPSISPVMPAYAGIHDLRGNRHHPRLLNPNSIGRIIRDRRQINLIRRRETRNHRAYRPAKIIQYATSAAERNRPRDRPALPEV